MKDWQRRYRSSKERWHYQMIRLDHEDAETLRALAKRKGVSVPELIRTFVVWGLEEYDDKPPVMKPSDRRTPTSNAR